MGEFDWWLLVVIPAVVGLATAYSQRFIDLFARLLWQGWRKRRARKYQRDMLAVINDIGMGTFYARVTLWIARGAVCLFMAFALLFALQTGLSRTDPALTFSNMTVGGWIVSITITLLCMFLSGWSGVMFGRATRYISAFLNPTGYVAHVSKRILEIIPETETEEMDGVAQLARGIVLQRERQLVGLLNEQP